jgi:hypothetical protein
LAAYSVAGLMMARNEPSSPEAKRLLSEAFTTGSDPADDRFTQ